MWLGWVGSRGDPGKGLGNQGLLEQEKKICSSSKSNELLKIQTTAKTRKNSKNEKGAKTRVLQTYPP